MPAIAASNTIKMQIASAYHMLSFDKSEAYIIIFSINYNRLQMSVQLIVDYDRF